MKKSSWNAVFKAAIVSGGVVALAAGCGDDGEENPTVSDSGSVMADAGCPGGPAADAGCPGGPAADAGCPGCPAADAGCPGCPAADAGCPGCPAADAGCPGCPAADAGCPGCPGSLPTTPAGWSAWLAMEPAPYMGAGWHCDTGFQAPIGNSPHGQNMICVNDTLYNAPAGTGAYPVGSVAVKVLETGGVLFVDARVNAMAGAAGWYFHREGGPQGMGSEGAVSGCVNCHDDDGRDFVRRVPE